MGDKTSSELAILAAAPVVAAHRFLFRVPFGLARDAQAHARHRNASRLGNGFAAFRTVVEACSLWQAFTRTADRVLDSCVDLVLNCTIFCEPSGHAAF